MHIKSALALSVLSASTFFASIGPAVAYQQQNFLLGAEIGYARQKEDVKTRFTVPSFSTIPAVGTAGWIPGLLPSHSEMISDKGTLFGLLAGYQWQFKRMLFGIEGNVNFARYHQPRRFMFSDNSASTNLGTLVDYSGTAYYDRGPVWALTSRIGYFVTPAFMPYVRLGAQVSEDEVNLQLTPLVAGQPTAFGNDFSSRKKTNAGIVAGIGFELPTLIGASTLRVEYLFSRTERIHIEDDLLPVVGTHHFHYPETNAIKVSWVWNFL